MSMGGGGYFNMPGSANALGGRNQRPAQQQMPPEYLAQLREQNRIKKMVAAYDASPGAYSEDKAMQIQQLAVQAGIPFEIKSTPGTRWKKGLLSALDTAAFGLLPIDEMYRPVNEAERKAVQWGSLAGMALPWGGPGRVVAGLANVGRGLRAGKGIKGALKGGGAMERFFAGARNVNPMMRSSKWLGGQGKVFKEGAGRVSKSAAGMTKFEIPKKLLGKNASKTQYFNYFQKIIKKGGVGGAKTAKGTGKGFWSNVNKGGTLDEQVNAGLAWMKKNLPPNTLKSVGVKRLRGTIKGLIKKGSNRYKGAKITDKSRLLGGGAKPKQIPWSVGGGPRKIATKVSPGGGTKLSPSELITKFNKKTTGGGVKPLKTVSNSLKRVISSGKKLKAGQFKQILAKMNPAYRQLVLKIKDVTKRNNVAKEWAKNNLLT